MLQRTLSITIAATAICCLGITNNLSAASTGTTITYTASGTFSATPVSGADTLRLAGEPFSVTIAVSSSTKPYKTGKNWDAYNQLKLSGTVHSGLLGTSPINIASKEASIIQAIDPSQYDQFTMETPLSIVGIDLTIKAVIQMPYGTIKNPLLQPFSTVNLTATDATMTYTDGGASTVLAIASGTLTATTSGGSTQSAISPVLHSNGARGVTVHADGTESSQSIATAPVEMGNTADTVMLRFYAQGVSGASDVQVQIGGEAVPVVYAAASAYYPGLDEVMVRVPLSLAGRGMTDVTLTVDGQIASPVVVNLR